MIVFIALELEQEVRGEIHRHVRERVMPLCRGGRWVDKDNYHITLKYIGEVGERDIEALDCILKEAAGRQGVFHLSTGRMGVFGKSRDGRARVLWLDVAGDMSALRGLRQDIEENSVGFGTKPDKGFSPHITLARDVILTRPPDGIESPKGIRIDAASVSLMESRVERGKRVYVPVGVYKFS